jgi:hypothetical protein
VALRTYIRILICCVAWSAVLAAAPGVARAADRAEEDLIHRGVEARKKRDDATALDLFKKAYALHHSPRSAAQMGLAEIALGRWVEAQAHLQEGIAAKGDPWVQKNAKTLGEALARVQREIGMLEVLGSPEGAEIVIEGEVKGALPLPSPIVVRAGEVRFALRAPGHLPETRTVLVSGGQLTRETVALSPVPAPPPLLAGAGPSPTAGRTPAAGADAVVTGPTPADEGEAPSPGRRRGLRAAGLIVTGVGVAAVGAGLAFGLKARSAGTSDSKAPTFNPDNEAAGHRYQTLQWVGYGVGAGLIVGGVITYVIGTRSHASSTQIGLAVAPGGAVAAVGGAF